MTLENRFEKLLCLMQFRMMAKLKQAPWSAKFLAKDKT
jgi:hypothetical protein